MYLAYRSLEAADIEPCLSLVRDEYAQNPDVYPHAARLWRQLREADTLNGMVLEDLTRAPGERLAAFGMSVFVTPEFMAEARRGETPGPAALLAQWLRAGTLPVLGPDAVRRANSGPGLHLLVLHYAERVDPPSPERLQSVRDKQAETFFYVHGGHEFLSFRRRLTLKICCSRLSLNFPRHVRMKADFAPSRDVRFPCFR